jgi:hypothetical protein
MAKSVRFLSEIIDFFFRVSQEFCALMVRREREKTTVEDVKQIFRVFDKVSLNVVFYSIIIFMKIIPMTVFSKKSRNMKDGDMNPGI